MLINTNRRLPGTSERIGVVVMQLLLVIYFITSYLVAFILACFSAFDASLVVNLEVIHVLVIEVLQVEGSKVVVGRITIILLAFLSEGRKILLDLLLHSFGDFLSHEGMILTFGFLFGFFSLLI